MATISKLQEPNIIWESIILLLPKSPYGELGGKLYRYNRFWTNGEEILCNNLNDCVVVAAFLETIFECGLTIKTGYYDPKEDDRDGLQDENTGYYYITID